MTDAAPPASKAADHGFSPWLTPVRIALIVWAAMSLIAIVARWHAIATLELSDTDDAMRMAQVRDLLAGQGWWDLTQYRVNPAGGGVLMHWSRIVDAPLAFGILLLKPLLGQTLAEQVVMTLWPPLLGAALSVACVRGYRDLSDRRIAYVVPLYLVAATVDLDHAQFGNLRHGGGAPHGEAAAVEDQVAADGAALAGGGDGDRAGDGGGDVVPFEERGILRLEAQVHADPRYAVEGEAARPGYRAAILRGGAEAGIVSGHREAARAIDRSGSELAHSGVRNVGLRAVAGRDLDAITRRH